MLQITASTVMTPLNTAQLSNCPDKLTQFGHSAVPFPLANHRDPTFRLIIHPLRHLLVYQRQ